MIHSTVLPSEVNKPFKASAAGALDGNRARRHIDVFRNVQKFQRRRLRWKAGTRRSAKVELILTPDSCSPNAKYDDDDIAEAKKLLAAAGYPSGFEIVTSSISGTQLGPDFQKPVEVRQDLLREAGTRPKVNPIDYTLEYLPKYLTSAGKFDGLVYRSGVASANDAVTWLDWRYKSGGGDGWIGFDLAGKGDGSGDPEVDAVAEPAARSTLKSAGRWCDLSAAAKAQWAISEPGITDGSSWLAGARQLPRDQATAAPAYSWWLDEAKAPLKSRWPLRRCAQALSTGVGCAALRQRWDLWIQRTVASPALHLRTEGLNSSPSKWRRLG